jgi:hypothetical protein
MATIGNFKTSSTRGKSPELHVCRVRRGIELVAEVRPYGLDPDKRGHSDPYRFIQQFPASASRREFVKQLAENGVSAEEIRMLLDGPTEPQEKISKPRKTKLES